MKSFLLGVLSIVLAVCVLAIGGEAAIRAHHFIEHILTGNSVRPFVLDEEFGWLSAPGFRYEGERLDAAGVNYPVLIQTNEAGFRLFGDSQTTDKRKVLFLGDSFTHAMQVSNDKTYYSILKDRLSLEVFALGVGGYGTLQEYLILDKYIDEIAPDIIVLQFCPNDIINNHYGLEWRSASNNNAMQRPYLTEAGIVYALPKNYSAIRNFANNYSRFLYFIFSKIDRILVGRGESVEDTIDKEGLSYPLFRDSIGITEQLIAKIRKRAPPTTPIVAFSTDNTSLHIDEFRRMSQNNGIVFLDDISQALASAEQAGVNIRAGDKAHWNNTGHQIVADGLQRYLEEVSK
jgi:lysophospholipase L1-like esterase